MAEKPVITPAQFLAIEGVKPDDNRCEVAIVGCCPFHGMTDKAAARPLEKSLFINVDRAHQFVGTTGGHEVLMVDCVYGGPVCATVVEEMAVLGARRAIGFGWAGSLRKDIPPGSVVLASSGIVSDGASREYSSAREVAASPSLVRAFEGLDAPLRAGVRAGVAWTTDAMYREYPSRIGAWREAGADFVNMDTSHFYAVSQAVGIDALYFAVISDYVGGEEWDQQFGNLRESREQLEELVLRLARHRQ